MSKSDPNHEDLPEKYQKILKDLVSQCEKEDLNIRKQQVKEWKKADEFWHGMQYVYWSQDSEDWVSAQDSLWFDVDEGRLNASGPFYDHVMNIYKAHGESIIAALSAQVPAVRFPPDNAEDEDDIATSKTYSKVSDLIERHNKSKLILLKALLCLWNQGTVFAYHAPKADKAFGNIKLPHYSEGLECPTCRVSFVTDESEEGEGDHPVEGDDCPNCLQIKSEVDQHNEISEAHGQPKAPEIPTGKLEKANVLNGFEEAPKTRVLIDIFSPLYVRVPHYARTQKDFSYLILNLDQPLYYLKSLYPKIADKLEQDSGSEGQAEKTARSASSYGATQEQEGRYLATLKRVWLRPYLFASLPKEQEKERKWLEKEFPDGCFVCLINNRYAESRNEDMDEYWTTGQAGLSTYIHSDSLGKPLVGVNELYNTMLNLTVETIEQGIPSVFADPKVLNFEAYGNHEAAPGEIYEATPITPGGNISQSFWEGPRATLSKEVPGFIDALEKKGQFLTGALPSIFGGVQDAKSRTAAEYSMSRQMAMQRLSICWFMICTFWADMMSKCTRMYVENMVGDEHHAVKTPGSSEYVNIWIRQENLNGKVGQVESESSETFPTTIAQKQAALMKLIEMQNEFINQAIFDPMNLTEVSDLLGFEDFHIPGEDQKLKQMIEIQQMIKGEQTIPEELIDDHALHIAICIHFMVDNTGLDLKRTNPTAYEAISQHVQIHQMMEQKKVMEAAQMQQQVQPQGAPNGD